jgi:hypothetical protein
MPFTLSHIAAVLPFRKYTPKKLSFTALVIGSMVPDFEYFVRMTLYGHYGHTFSGIFLFDIPMGMILYCLYQGIIQQPLIKHLPPFLFVRYSNTLIPDWSEYLRSRFLFILLSLIIGIITHFIWDGFTHDDEYQVARYVPFLLQNVPFRGHLLPVHFILQILSSIVGLMIIFFWIFLQPRQSVQPLPVVQLVKFWLLVIVGTLLIGYIRYLAGIPTEKLFFQYIVISISAFLLSLLLVCIYYRIENK